ncbi:MAG: hypothetical protein ABI378_02745 [Chitinophagaceae bacterium]
MKSIFAIFLTLLSVQAFSQKTPLFTRALSLEYDDVSVGRNFNLTYHHAVSKTWALYGGIKYHINRFGTPDNQHNTFIKRFYAEKQIQHFGLKLGLEKAIYRSATAELYAYYDFQFTRAIIRHTDYSPYGIDSAGTYLYTYGTFLFGPINTYENTFGVGTRFKLTDKLFIKGFISGGAMLLTFKMNDFDHKTALVGNSDFEFIRMFGAGIEYKLR